MDGVVHIGEESMTISSQAGVREISYADVRDLRLINYHLFLYLFTDTVELSWLGKDTESFFEHVWSAINKQSEKALFNETKPEREIEADYAYNEVGGLKASGKGRAKIHLYQDGICIFPHDNGSRRIPLCFVSSVNEKGYELTINLDTGDSYMIARMGQETTPFLNKMNKFLSESREKWQKAHADLAADFQNRLGDRLANCQVMSSLPVKIIAGLFSPDMDDFYFAGIGRNRAAVELVIGESSATYLYEFDCSADDFERSLRHAMEAVNKNREVIYADAETLQEKPLYRMAISRSYHVAFLRSKMVGKVIHNAGWEGKIREFLG